MSIMGQEIDLLINYPRTKRNLLERLDEKTDQVRSIARKFDIEFFDGDRKYGYGGFSYNPQFWKPVIPTFDAHWNLENKKSLLDVGCAKGFMLHDLQKIFPHLILQGVDVSHYAIQNCIPSMKKNVFVADAKSLPFASNSFDIVVSINTIHNLDEPDCRKAIREIQRVSSISSFITVDAYRNQEEKKRMEAWNLTAKTIHSVDRWKEIFAEEGYTGDFFWFIP